MKRTEISLACLLLLGLGTASERTGACSAKSPSKSAKIEVGSQAPDLEAVDHLGKTVKLRFKDAPVTLVYFYPKDNTPG